jgi:hypothetical protein
VTYTWSVPSGWGAINGHNSNDITVTAGSTGGEITVTSSSSYGSSTSQTLAVTVGTVPEKPGTISGSTSVTSGATGQIYSVEAVDEATSYEWTLPSGWNITAGQDSHSITVTAGTSGGGISVKAKNSCGFSEARTLPVTVVSDCSGATVFDGAYDGPSAGTYHDYSGVFNANWSPSLFTLQHKDLCWAETDIAGRPNWANATTACAALTTDGVSTGSWRLPNLMELHVLYKAIGGTGNSATDFANLGEKGTANEASAMQSNYYWSSTEGNADPNVLSFYFSNGTRYTSSKTENTHYTRCVRSL